MIFWFGSKVLEYGTSPEPLHKIPILDLTLPNGVIHTVSLGVGDRFISNKVVQVIDSTFAGQVARLAGDRWTSTARGAG